jgi:hypothetical protein
VIEDLDQGKRSLSTLKEMIKNKIKTKTKGKR